jgi:hypothetical protein
MARGVRGFERCQVVYVSAFMAEIFAIALMSGVGCVEGYTVSISFYFHLHLVTYTPHLHEIKLLSRYCIHAQVGRAAGISFTALTYRTLRLHTLHSPTYTPPLQLRVPLRIPIALSTLSNISLQSPAHLNSHHEPKSHSQAPATGRSSSHFSRSRTFVTPPSTQHTHPDRDVQQRYPCGYRAPYPD